MNVYLKACIEAAEAGGYTTLDFKPTTLEVKTQSIVGHHAIVTDVDYRSQKAIVEKLRQYDKKDFWLMTEEHVDDEDSKRRLIRSGNLDRLTNSPGYIVDELDGTSSLRVGHYEYSISVGHVSPSNGNLVHDAGAVFAPAVFGGALFYASK